MVVEFPARSAITSSCGTTSSIASTTSARVTSSATCAMTFICRSDSRCGCSNNCESDTENAGRTSSPDRLQCTSLRFTASSTTSGVCNAHHPGPDVHAHVRGGGAKINVPSSQRWSGTRLPEQRGQHRLQWSAVRRASLLRRKLRRTDVHARDTRGAQCHCASSGCRLRGICIIHALRDQQPL